jgi:hypothetical protein
VPVGEDHDRASSIHLSCFPPGVASGGESRCRLPSIVNPLLIGGVCVSSGVIAVLFADGAGRLL